MTGRSGEWRVVEIGEVAHLGPTLARWHAQEWGHLYDPDVWDEATAGAEFAAQRSPGTIPTTYVAVDIDDAPLGSVSLVDTDDLDGFDHLHPWLASLYVHPEARGHGVGGALVQHLLTEAARLGHAHVHLFTDTHEEWYHEQGWSTIDQAEARGRNVAVMRIDVPAEGPIDASGVDERQP